MKTKVLLSFVALSAALGLSLQAHAQPSENEIADIVHTADEAEVKAAKVAKDHASNQGVKDFAQLMIDEHNSNMKEEKSITKHEKISMRSNDTSKQLKKDASAKLKDIKKLKGVAFDKAYIDQQVAMHQQLLNDLNNTYIPAASHPEFKDYLNKTKESVQDHLAKAQQIQSSLER